VLASGSNAAREAPAHQGLAYQALAAGGRADLPGLRWALRAARRFLPRDRAALDVAGLGPSSLTGRLREALARHAVVLFALRASVAWLASAARFAVRLSPRWEDATSGQAGWDSWHR